MSETPLGSYQTLNHTEKEWIGHVINRAATLVPRSEDRILIRYGFTRGRATRNEVLLGNTLQIPEEIRDERLSLASVDRNGNWVSFYQTEPSHQEFRDVPDVYNLLYHMRKGQKILKVGLIQGDPQSTGQDEDSTMMVVELIEIYHQDNLRTFYFPKLPSEQFSAKLNQLNGQLGLTVERGRSDAVITVDIRQYSLMDVHRTLGEMLLSRKTHLPPGDGTTKQSVEFIAVAADIILMRDADQEAIFLAFARECGLEEQVLEDVRQKKMLRGIF